MPPKRKAPVATTAAGPPAIAPNPTPAPLAQTLAAYTFSDTGGLEVSRSELLQLITGHGGQLVPSAGPGVQYLVTNVETVMGHLQEPNTDIEEAVSRGIHMISVDGVKALADNSFNAAKHVFVLPKMSKPTKTQAKATGKKTAPAPAPTAAPAPKQATKKSNASGANFAFAISGTLSATRAEIKKRIASVGAKYVDSGVTNVVTHLISTEAEVDNGTAKVLQAQAKDIPIVSEEFLDALLRGEDPDEGEYLIGEDASAKKPAKKVAAPKKAAAAKKAAAKKVESEDEDDDDDGMDVEPPMDKSNPKKRPAQTDIASGPFKQRKIEPSKIAPKVPTYKANAAQPQFPLNFEIVEHVIMQMTDIGNNNNKYYSLELHDGGGGDSRLFTHYGRTCDLETNPNAGQRELRYYSSLPDAMAGYLQIMKEKTKKGYKPVNISASRIGSPELQALTASTAPAKPAAVAKKTGGKKTTLPEALANFVQLLYNEATHSLTQRVNAQITENGIETPLGVLTIDQVEKGEEILNEIQKLTDPLTKSSKNQTTLQKLSSDFYSTIPHRLGRSGADLKAAVITTNDQYKEKMDLIQLMKDMLLINDKGGEEGSTNVLYEDDLDAKYKALGCTLEVLDEKSKEYKEVVAFLKKTEFRKDPDDEEDNAEQNVDDDEELIYQVTRIVKVTRAGERKAFNKKIGNERRLYHGSRISNWVGLLTRGILMPEAVLKNGGRRTDFGWLGAGIYFGDCHETSAQYAQPGEAGTSIMALCNVALGKIATQTTQDGTISAPPKGFNSIHGDPNAEDTEFDDDEFCIYQQNQQFMEYVVEFEF